MFKLSEKSRRVLRAVYRGLGATAITMAVNACDINDNGRGQGWAEYGMPPDYLYDDYLIQGYIRSKKTGEGIYGIIIYNNSDSYSYRYYSQSYSDGYFCFYMPKMENENDTYTFIFTDVDGEDNGGRFKQHTITLTKAECEAMAENPLIIGLEEEKQRKGKGKEGTEDTDIEVIDA